MDESQLIAAAAKHHKIDVPVRAIRIEGDRVVITVQPGVELSCKLSEISPETAERIRALKKSAPQAPKKPAKRSAAA